MYRWKIIGIIATALIVVAIPLSVVKYHYRLEDSGHAKPGSVAVFVGSEKCRTCHQPEHELWKGSNHYSTILLF